ncbi:class I SAM-dependent methyltransferase [Halobacteriovorax sp. HLS]|uniref:class I SAM-dependent methyltransferase n=1 Tax=Halobacteriovorax sp. HLS TaxID=2234000 RepID=UPI0013E3C5B9|nr:class I SAM-dependent methyltransferase [Halobacteriovorax sp. HLS]
MKSTDLDLFYSEIEQNFKKIAQSKLAQRLYHGRGGTYEELNFFNIDFYSSAVFITLFKDLPFDSILGKLRSIFGQNFSVILQRRYLKPVQVEQYGTEISSPFLCEEMGLKFYVNLLENQNPGLFLDMKEGKKWLRDNSREKSILNLFSYTCSVSVFALAGGASKVLNIDQKKSFLNIGRENHRQNNFNSRAEFRNWDVKKSMNQIAKQGPFDIIFCDPPTNQAKSFFYKNDYSKIIEKSSKVLSVGGYFVACLNTPFETSEYLQKLFLADSNEWEYVKTLFSSDDFREIDKENGVKIVIYRLIS